MYAQYFGLQQMPFSITPGTEFAFASRAHQEALNTLLVAVKGGEGFVKITGEVGTGKTMLCRRFLNILQKDGLTTAYVPNPALQPHSLLLSVAHELGIRMQDEFDEYGLLKRLNQTLVRVAQRGGSVVVCLDEAQALPDATLEAVRLLSNLETEKRKLLQLVLFGQPELNEKLADPLLRPLCQRISFSYKLSGMSLREVDRYVAHRLTVAGYGGAEIFSRCAIGSLHQASGGVPRLVNILCHKALMAAYGEGIRQVDARHIKAAADDTDAASKPGWLSPARWFSPFNWGHG